MKFLGIIPARYASCETIGYLGRKNSDTTCV